MTPCSLSNTCDVSGTHRIKYCCILFFFFSSTTLCEFWLAQLFLSISSSAVSFVSNYSLPSSSSHSSHRVPILLLAFPSVLLHTFSICIWSWPLFHWSFFLHAANHIKTINSRMWPERYVVSLGARDWILGRPSDCLVDGSVRTLKNNFKTTSRSFKWCIIIYSRWISDVLVTRVEPSVPRRDAITLQYIWLRKVWCGNCI